jgi:hypothetical protein
MNNGIYIQESLADLAVNDLLVTLKTETRKNFDKLEALPSRTLIYFTFNELDADNLAGRFSLSLKFGYFVTFFTSTEVYVIFPERFFKYTKGLYGIRENIIAYGQAHGIPKQELEWAEQ